MGSDSQKLTWLISKEKQQNIDPASCKLMGEKTPSTTTHQVDTCFRVNHINEFMPSEIDYGAHETHLNGHSIIKVDWGCHDPSLYHMDVCMHSEVNSGAHDSCFFVYLVHIDHDARPKDFFAQGIWGDFHKCHLLFLIWST